MSHVLIVFLAPSLSSKTKCGIYIIRVFYYVYIAVVKRLWYQLQIAINGIQLSSRNGKNHLSKYSRPRPVVIGYSRPGPSNLRPGPLATGPLAESVLQL